ncbi:MAG: HesA/MoeB/ThiF family protein [Candidatus Woesearchaeota archaeon]
MKIERYARQIVFDRIGMKGQERLANARIAIIGLGGLGGIAAELLCRAGVGRLVVFDSDNVDISNLHRQVLYNEKDIGQKKAEVAKQKLLLINSDVKVVAIHKKANMKTLEEIGNIDVILDCTDNLEARFAINDYCLKQKVPWIYAGVLKEYGAMIRFVPGGPCLRCVIKDDKKEETTAISGILNTLPSFVGALQATEAIKVLFGENTKPLMFKIDIWKGEIKKIKIKKRPECICSSYTKNYKKL